VESQKHLLVSLIFTVSCCVPSLFSPFPFLSWLLLHVTRRNAYRNATNRPVSTTKWPEKGWFVRQQTSQPDYLLPIWRGSVAGTGKRVHASSRKRRQRRLSEKKKKKKKKKKKVELLKWRSGRGEPVCDRVQCPIVGNSV
jgi:hypothetical protein